MRVVSKIKILAIVILAQALAFKSVGAETAPLADRLTVELNKLVDQQGACRITFVMRNGMTASIEKMSLEIVLFDKQRKVVQLLAIDPGRLPAGKTRVKQFDVKALGCNDIGQLLINDVSGCEGKGLTPIVCLEALSPRSLLDIPFIN